MAPSIVRFLSASNYHQRDLEIILVGFAVAGQVAVVFFDRFDGVSGPRPGSRFIERNNPCADEFAVHYHVDEFATLRWTPPIHLNLGQLIVGLSRPSDLDVPDVLAGHDGQSQKERTETSRVASVLHGV